MCLSTLASGSRTSSLTHEDMRRFLGLSTLFYQPLMIIASGSDSTLDHIVPLCDLEV
jgi:hypothetical protein